MKKLVFLASTLAALLTGCVLYDEPPRRDRVPYGDLDRDGVPNRADRDRDGDGVRNRQDRRPDDARRY
jgi:hypothetical protein